MTDWNPFSPEDANPGQCYCSAFGAVVGHPLHQDGTGGYFAMDGRFGKTLDQTGHGVPGRIKPPYRPRAWVGSVEECRLCHQVRPIKELYVPEDSPVLDSDPPIYQWQCTDAVRCVRDAR